MRGGGTPSVLCVGTAYKRCTTTTHLPGRTSTTSSHRSLCPNSVIAHRI